MPKRTIAKIFAFVIWFAAVCMAFQGCSSSLRPTDSQDGSSPYEHPKVIGTIRNPDITESSGIAVSKCQPNVLWTHNDSGDDAFIFATNSSGESLGTWKVAGARNNDWEDIAEFKDGGGKCFIYIGDIGDNSDKRLEYTVYRVAEPRISLSNTSSSKQNPLETENAEILRFAYPDSSQNAETLMVQPQTGDIYVLTKHPDKPSSVYKLKSLFGSQDVVQAEKISDFKVPAIPNGLLTSGDISPDGKRVVICDYSAAYEITLPEGSTNFDDIWKQKPIEIDLGDRKQGEAVGYSADGTAIFAASEEKNSPIIKVDRRK